jgi:hypothetical protein
MNHIDNAQAEEKTAPVSDITFDALLDETCERLLDRQVKYAIQRIYEMEKRLDNLESELDEFLSLNRNS